MATKWQRSSGNNNGQQQQSLDLTGFGKVIKVEDDGGAVIESVHPRYDHIVVPSKTALMYYRSRLNGGDRLGVGDSVCYVANRSFVAQLIAATVSGWGVVTSLQRGHGFLADEKNFTNQIFFPGSAVTDDLWNFHNLTQSLRVGDQLQFNGWDQMEYLDRTSTSLKAEMVSLPTMTGVTGDAERSDIGFVMQQQSPRRFECVLYCNPYGPVLLHKDDVDERVESWPPQLGARFVFEAVAENSGHISWRAIRALSSDMLLKQPTSLNSAKRSQKRAESSRDGDYMMKEFNNLSSMSALSITTNKNNDRRVVEIATVPKKPTETQTTLTSSMSQVKRSQQSNGGTATLPVTTPPVKPATCERPEKATQTEYYPIQIRFINTIVNDPEILEIITKRYTAEFYELIQAQQ